MNFIRSVTDSFLQLLFPNNCIGCGSDLPTPQDYFCIHCIYHWPRTYFERYKKNSVEKIWWGRANIQDAMTYSFFKKGSGVQQLLHLLKYKNEPRAAELMGNMMAAALKKSTHYQDVQILVPVPMHRSKQRQRGYNQAELIANAISDNWSGTICVPALSKVSSSESQTNKSRWGRWLNMSSRFQINNPQSIEGKNILLIDDVITTGATIESCATTLANASPASIRAAGFAWTAPNL